MAEAVNAAPPVQGVMPAEWERHDATWIGWPANLTDWPGKFSPIPWVYAEIARKVVPGETLRVLVNSKDHEQKARRVLSRAGADCSGIEFYRVPTNRGWTRDSGPLFVRTPQPPGGISILRCRFTGWAKYPDWKHDDAVPLRVGRSLGLNIITARHRHRDVVLEGGSFDVNGRGTLVTTEECLLDTAVQVRNPGFTRGDYEQVFQTYLGVSRVLWLGSGIAGDDTHGHVDDLCRFINPTTVVLCQEQDPSDANYRALQENRERLEGAHLEDGSKLTVVGLPMPAPLYFDGRRLPASYANFYVSNSAVLVPTFNDRNDRTALGILGELITDRPVVGIHAVDLVWGLGTLHCLTQQQPAAAGGAGESS